MAEKDAKPIMAAMAASSDIFVDWKVKADLATVRETS